MIPGWRKKYAAILSEFGYDEKRDVESARILDGIIRESDAARRIRDLICGNTVSVIGSGPSLSRAIPRLNRLKETMIAADSSLKPLLEGGIVPDIVVTDLDGDRKSLEKIAKKSVFVVHAHGDNIDRLSLAKKFRHCIGTTQAKPSGRIRNFGGFTDGDRGVFLASHFQAKRIILFGMDFGSRIGRFSDTMRSERGTKLKKLAVGRSLLEWLATITKSELFTTSAAIAGFEKIPYKGLDDMIV